MTRWRIAAVVCLLLGAGGMTAVLLRNTPPQPQPHAATRRAVQSRTIRRFAIGSTRSCNRCDSPAARSKRIGEAHDGGYVMCANLLDAEAGYSYGISNYDGWGCGVSTGLGVPVHQYDCFDQRAPRCDGGQTQFHAGVHRRLVERRRRGSAIRFACQPDRPQRRCVATAGHEDGRRRRRVEEPARDAGRGPRAHRPDRDRDARQRGRRVDAAARDRRS